MGFFNALIIINGAITAVLLFVAYRLHAAHYPTYIIVIPFLLMAALQIVLHYSKRKRLLDENTADVHKELATKTVSQDPASLSCGFLRYKVGADELRQIARQPELPKPVRIGICQGVAGSCFRVEDFIGFENIQNFDYVFKSSLGFIQGELSALPFPHDRKSYLAYLVRTRNGTIIGVVLANSSRAHDFTPECRATMIGYAADIAKILRFGPS